MLAKKLEDWWNRCGDSHELWDIIAEVRKLEEQQPTAATPPPDARLDAIEKQLAQVVAWCKHQEKTDP